MSRNQNSRASDVHTLVAIFIAPGCEHLVESSEAESENESETHVERVIEIKIVVAVEVSPDEVVDLGLGGGVHVLELVHCLELNDIETFGRTPSGLRLSRCSLL